VDQPDYVIENEECSKSAANPLARLIKKRYEVNPLLCLPNAKGKFA